MMKAGSFAVALGVVASLALSGCRGAGPEATAAATPGAEATMVKEYYDSHLADDLVPLLTEVVAFQTFEGNDEAHAAQKAWLEETATSLGFGFRDAGTMQEVTLPGPDDAPVLGLLVHGDVVRVEEAKWSFPPFDATVVEGMVQGRGVADDKGPLIQALLAMKALAESGPERHAAIRLIVGTSEESTGDDVTTYLESNEAPELSLVLDSDFPLNLGEKAWNALYVFAPIAAPQVGPQPWIVEDIRAGLSTSIVPDEARVVLSWSVGDSDWSALIRRLEAQTLPEGTTLEIVEEGRRLKVTTRGVSAHAGDNLRNGRNALVALARVLEGELPNGSPALLLAFARMAGADLDGGGLGIDQSDPVWGTYDVNVATILPDKDDPSLYRLAINVRRIPPWTQDDLKQHLAGVVETFNREHDSALTFDGWWDSEPLITDPESEAVKRLLAIYERATGEKGHPNVSSGGTYAKRMPRSITFGMWFQDTPYPGHGVDERVSIDSLQRGTHVLIEALVDLVCTAEPLPTVVRQGAMVED